MYAVGQWVEFHWQDPAGTWGFRRAQVAETEWWPWDPKVREQEETWGYRMEGSESWIYESDIIRKLSLLEIIAEVSRENGE